MYTSVGLTLVCFFAGGGLASTTFTSVSATVTDVYGKTLATDTESDPTSSSASIRAGEYPLPAPYTQGYPYGMSFTSGNGKANASPYFLQLVLDASFGPQYACSDNRSFHSCVTIASTTVTGTASLSDTITLLGGSGTANFSWNPSFACSIPACNPDNITFTVNSPSQVTYGVPFQISATLSGSVSSPSITCPDLRNYCDDRLFAQFFMQNPLVNGSTNFTYTSDIGAPVFNGAGTFVPTPEPSTLLLLGMGLTVLVHNRRRPTHS